MTYGSVSINTIPTCVFVASGEEIGVELRAAATRRRENLHKYIHDFGFRQLGDPLIDFRRDSKNYPYPQDVELIVECRAEEGYNLSYAEIKIDQSSTERETEIIDGGIGENFIRILIKARNTFWLNYEVRMYGKKIPLPTVHLERVKE